MKITISLPSVAPLNLTGAAARSAAASDAAAQSWLAYMQAAANRLTTALSSSPDATAIAEAIRATESYTACWDTAKSLAPRWRGVSACVDAGARKQSVYARERWILHDGAETIYCAAAAAEQYRDTLIAAGVPMSGGHKTASYWDDAAARGC